MLDTFQQEAGWLQGSMLEPTPEHGACLILPRFRSDLFYLFVSLETRRLGMHILEQRSTGNKLFAGAGIY